MSSASAILLAFFLLANPLDSIIGTKEPLNAAETQSAREYPKLLFLIAEATIFSFTSPHYGANGYSFLISFASTFHSIEKIRESTNLIAANLAARLSRHVALCACVQRRDRIFLCIIFYFTVACAVAFLNLTHFFCTF